MAYRLGAVACALIFKAIELDSTSRKRTGREHQLRAETRQAAISLLLEVLGATSEQVEVDPSRTLVKAGASLWTLVAMRPPATSETPSARRSGAKHKRVR